MRSFIGWIGGKSHLKNQIISLIPGDCERYIEVCGGASVWGAWCWGGNSACALPAGPRSWAGPS